MSTSTTVVVCFLIVAAFLAFLSWIGGKQKPVETKKKGKEWIDGGDLRAYDIRLRQVGWAIYGGPNSGQVVPMSFTVKDLEPMGSFSPVYVEIGDD